MALETLHSAKTDIGLRRQHNEDRYLADPGLGLYAVCDGMGGGNAGEIASGMAIDAIRAFLNTPAGTDRPTDEDRNVSPATARLAAAVREANQAIHRASWINPAYAGMGTTVVAVRLTDELLSIVHVGDSRLYLIRNGRLDLLTADHSWVAEQVQQGLMTEAEAERSPKRNIVTRALGVESSVEVDIGEISLLPGDRLLLCSDGLTRGVRPSQILQTINSAPSAEAAADQLIGLANAAGGEDNTTVLLVTIDRGKPGSLWQRVLQEWFPKAS